MGKSWFEVAYLFLWKEALLLKGVLFLVPFANNSHINNTDTTTKLVLVHLEIESV